MIFEVRYYFIGVPHNKHYGSRSFSNLSDALDFSLTLDSKHVESFEILSVVVVQKRCISSLYCPHTTKCKNCDFERFNNEVSDLYDS